MSHEWSSGERGDEPGTSRAQGTKWGRRSQLSFGSFWISSLVAHLAKGEMNRKEVG